MAWAENGGVSSPPYVLNSAVRRLTANAHGGASEYIPPLSGDQAQTPLDTQPEGFRPQIEELAMRKIALSLRLQWIGLTLTFQANW